MGSSGRERHGVRGEMQALMDSYAAAYDCADARGCAGVFAADALLMTPFGPPARGRGEIARLHWAWFAEPESARRLDVIEAGCADDLGWCLIRYGGETADAHEGGLNLCVMGRNAAGHWRIRRSCLVPDVQDSGAAPREGVRVQ